MRRHAIVDAVAIVGLTVACRGSAPSGTVGPGPALQVLGEATVIRSGDPVPARSPWFDGRTVRMTAARGETLGIQVFHRGTPAPALAFTTPGVTVRGFDVQPVRVARPSTELYGGSRGAGDYPDTLVEAAAPTTDPAYFEIHVGSDVAAGSAAGTLGALPVVLTVSPATMPALPFEGVWAYEDPREFAWAGLPASSVGAPSASERACIAMFQQYGVMLSPDIPIDAWPARQALLAGARDVPAVIPDDPATAPEAVRAWIAAGSATHQVPFAIPIDEPHGAAAAARVESLATAVRAAGGGSDTFRYAVTAAPSAELRGPIDLYLAGSAAHLAGDAVARWTYNGRPPEAGAMVVDAAEPGLRTWGWIAWRYRIPTWYAWDALYWHDRHDRHGAPLPGRALAAARDAVSFDDGEDHGNLDGVLAEPGDAAQPCRPTLRLAALRRGLEDRALLDAAAACDPAATNALAARVIPRALGDAHGDAAWPSSDAVFEQARVDAIQIAAGCTNGLQRARGR